jgi:hypothetical protein
MAEKKQNRAKHNGWMAKTAAKMGRLHSSNTKEVVYDKA